MLTFLLKVEGRPDRKIEVSESIVIAGSAPELPIVIEGAAERHAEINVRDVGVVLKDLATDTGTRVNGDLVSQIRLSVGDEIEIGGSKLVLTLVEAEAAPAPKPVVARPARREGPVSTAPSRVARAREQKKNLAVPLLAVVLVLAGGAAAFFILTKKGPERIVVPEVNVARAPKTGTATADRTPALMQEPEAPTPEPEEEPEEAPVVPAVREDEPSTPDPAAAAAAEAASAKKRHEDLLRRKEESARIRAAEKRYTRFRETLDDRIARYAFAGPIADLVKIAEPLPVGPMRGEALTLQNDLMRADAVFDRLKTTLGKAGRKVRLSSGITLTIVEADDEGFTASIRGAKTRKRWAELSPQTIHDVVAGEAKIVDHWVDLSAFAAVFGLPAVETDLVKAFEIDPSGKEVIDAAIARRRATEVPDGGYHLHEGEWITPKERDLVDKGYVKHEGQWLTPDQLMAARGYVKHEGKWLTKERYERILKAQKEAADLAAKYLPKGLLDKPGNGASRPWGRATEKAPVVLKTKHYKIHTNLAKAVAGDLAYTMEILNTNLKAQFGIRGKGAKFGIKVVASRDDYKTFWPRVGGMSLGFCSGSEICTFYQPPMTTGVLMHEGTHQILRKFAPSAPRWLHEGVACYFECSKFTFNEKRRRVELDVGLLNQMRCMGCQAQIRSGRAVSISQFISGQGGDPYQQGWAFIYYLAKGKDGEYAPKLHAFIQEAHKKDVVERFQKIFKVKDMAEFDREWREWVLALDPRKGVRMDGNHR